jgi:hypothetical protein
MKPIAFAVPAALLAACAVAGVACPDRAFGATAPDTIGIESGHCYRLIVASHDVSISCTPSVVNETSKNGRTGFTFRASALATVSFSGPSSAEVKTADGKISQPIDNITFRIVGVGALQSTTSSVGTCVYSDPNIGPAAVECAATASAGLFDARFVSDGREPVSRDVRTDGIARR